MRRYAVMILVLAVAAGMTWAADTTKKTTSEPVKTAPRSGDEKNATVSSLDVKKTEAGYEFTVTVKTEKGGSFIFYALPKNGGAYATVGALKMGDKVNLQWGMEGATSEKKLITSIQLIPKPKPATPAK